MASEVDFVPQSQETALDPSALQKLKDLTKLPGVEKTKFDQRLKEALLHLRTSAADINDHGYNERVRHKKKLKRINNANEEEPADEANDFKALQDRISMTTKNLDMATRTVIDDQTWLQDAPTAIDRVAKRLLSNAKRSRDTRTQTQQTNNSMDIDEEDGDGGDSLVAPALDENPSALLDLAFDESKDSWSSMTLTDRYSANNDYVDFYRTIFDANHQTEDRPPMPHANDWFAAEEGRSTRRGLTSSQQKSELSRTNDDDDDNEMPAGTADSQLNDAMSDIEVQAERISLKCPITLRFFEEPLKSTKCPHAFEKKHILEWLRNSQERAQITTEQQQELSQIDQPQERSRREAQLRQRIVRCPECNVPLTDKDLRPDPVLARMVQREIARLKKEEEQERRGTGTFETDDDSDDDDIPRATQRRNVVNVGSSPARSVRPRISGKNVKAERLSMVPQTQLEYAGGASDTEDG